jgi:hypothetical protein
VDRKEIDLGKQGNLDGHTKKEPIPIRNQSGIISPKWGNPKSTSK